MSRVCNVETQAKEVLDLAKKNEIIINEVLEKQLETKDDLLLRVRQLLVKSSVIVQCAHL